MVAYSVFYIICIVGVRGAVYFFQVVIVVGVLVLVPHDESDGASGGLASKMPERNSTLSDSLREVVMRDCPGRRRSSSDCTKSISMVIPAGNPSITPPMPLPCDSPKLVRRRILPNELNISIALRVYNEVNVPVCLVIKGFDFIKVTIFL